MMQGHARVIISLVSLSKIRTEQTKMNNLLETIDFQSTLFFVLTKVDH